MKLGTRGRYAVMAMVDLTLSGKEKDEAGPTAITAIADRQEISLSYLEKLFLELRTAGLVKSVRGAQGGYLLARPADEITVADIVRAVGESIQTTRCKNDGRGGCMSQRQQCSVHHLWEELGNQLYWYLSSVTLQDVCDRKVVRPRPTQKEGPHVVS